MRNHTKLRVLELADEAAALIYRVTVAKDNAEDLTQRRKDAEKTQRKRAVGLNAKIHSLRLCAFASMNSHPIYSSVCGFRVA